MNIFRILFRSLFKRGKHNLIKIISLSVELSLGLVLIAKVYFEQSYNDFFPDKEVVVNSYSAEMIDQYSESVNFRNSVLAAGLITLIICLMGLIGYTNDETNRRKKETAIRRINGATLFDIQRMFLKDINYMALPSIIIGCIAYFIAKSWLENFAEKAEMTVFLFAICALVVLFIIIATVGIGSYNVANENPAESIKTNKIPHAL